MAMRRSRIKMAPNLGAKARGPAASRASGRDTAKPVSDGEVLLKQEPSDSTSEDPVAVVIAKPEPVDAPAVQPPPPIRPLPDPTPSPPPKVLPMVPPSPPPQPQPVPTFSPPAKPAPARSPTQSAPRITVLVSPPARQVAPTADLAIGPIVPAEALIGISKITPMSDAEEVDSDGSLSQTLKPDPDMNKSPMARVRNRFPKAKPNLGETGRGRIRHNSVSSRDEDDSSTAQRILSRQRQPSISETTPSSLKTSASNEGSDSALPTTSDPATCDPATSDPTTPEPVRPPVTNSLGIDMGCAIIKRPPRVSRDEDGNKKKPKKMLRIDGPIDRSKVTMKDLIYMNPTANPMKSTLAEKERLKKLRQKIKSESEDDTRSVISDGGTPEVPKEEENVVKEDTEPVPAPAPAPEETPEDSAENKEPPEPENLSAVPQVRIGLNGEIILNETSLLLDNRDPEADKKAAAMELIEETDFSMSRFSYGRKHACKLWTEMETKKFYLALSAVGTDFSLMGNLFPTRSRTELKRKFKREERTNRALIDRAIREQQQFDMEFFDNLVALQIDEPVKKRKRGTKKEPESGDDQDTPADETRPVKTEVSEKAKEKQEKKKKKEEEKAEKKKEKAKLREAKKQETARKKEEKVTARKNAQETDQGKENMVEENTGEKTPKKRGQPPKSAGSQGEEAATSNSQEPRPKRTRRKPKALIYDESGGEEEETGDEWEPPAADGQKAGSEGEAEPVTEKPKRKRGRKPKVNSSELTADGEPKAKRPRKKSQIMTLSEKQESESGEPVAGSSNAGAEEETPKPKRGRKPKVKSPESTVGGTADESTPKPKRQRKTNKKNKTLTPESNPAIDTATSVESVSRSTTGRPMTARDHLRLLEREPELLAESLEESAKAPIGEAPLSELLESTESAAGINTPSYVFVASPPPVGCTGADAEPLIHVYLVSPSGVDTRQPPTFPNITQGNAGLHHPTPSPMTSPMASPIASPIASPTHIPIVILSQSGNEPTTTEEPQPEEQTATVAEWESTDVAQAVEESAMRVPGSPLAEYENTALSLIEAETIATSPHDSWSNTDKGVDNEETGLQRAENVHAEGDSVHTQDRVPIATGLSGDGDGSDKTESSHISIMNKRDEQYPLSENSVCDPSPKASQTQEIPIPQTTQPCENTPSATEPKQSYEQPSKPEQNNSGQLSRSRRRSHSGKSVTIKPSHSLISSELEISSNIEMSKNRDASESTELSSVSESASASSKQSTMEKPSDTEIAGSSENKTKDSNTAVGSEKTISAKEPVGMEKPSESVKPKDSEKLIAPEKPGLAMKGRRRRITAMPKIPTKRRPAAPTPRAAPSDAESTDNAQPIDEATASGILLEMSTLGDH